MDTNERPPDGPYTCNVYAHVKETCRFMLVCRRAPKKIIVEMVGTWKLVARGFEPPEAAKAWLKMNGFHQVWMRDPF